jgi:hypothetical protein
MIATKYKHIQEQLENERKRLTSELEQVQTSASSSEERREGSPFGKREEEATETLTACVKTAGSRLTPSAWKCCRRPVYV